MAIKPKHSRRRGCLVTVIVLAGLVLLVAGISALTNIGLPQPENSDKLTSLDKARLAEALNIKIQPWQRISGRSGPPLQTRSSCSTMLMSS